MTPAVRSLRRAGVPFEVLHYDPGAASFGAVAVEALGLGADEVFKTLVVGADDGFAVAVVPVGRQLSPKAAANALRAKRVELADPAEAQRVTGYVVGGISPFGQRRRLVTVVDEVSRSLEQMYVSGGRRGLEIVIRPADLVAVLEAVVAPIST